jgi:hypothetical protein
MAHAANQQSASGSTNAASKPKPKVKKPAKGKAPKSPSTAHSGYVPAPVDPLQVSANQQAAAIYAPQVNANASLQASVPSWYAEYQTRAAAQAAQQQAQTAPVLAQQQAFAQNVNAPAAGLDPSSAEYGKSQQAGKGLSALAQFSVDNTQANLGAGQQYFAGQQANAARYLPEARSVLAQQGGQLASQQAGKAQELYQGAKTQAINTDIAYRTLTGNQANQQAGNLIDAGYDPITGKKLPPKPATPGEQKTAADLAFFEKHGYYPATGPPKPTGPTDAQKRATATKKAADSAKKTATIQKAIGKAKNKVQDIQDAWAQGGTVEYTVQQKDPKTGKVTNVKKTRPIKRDELRGSLTEKYGAQWVGIMERVRAGQAITPQQADYLHNQDPDFRVPKEWKTGRPKPKTNPAGTTGNTQGTTPGQYRPG